MSPLGHRSQPHRHLLHIIGNRNQKQQKPYQMIPIFDTRSGISCNTAGIIVGNHHHKAGAGNNKVEADSFPDFFEPVVENGKKIHIR